MRIGRNRNSGFGFLMGKTMQNLIFIDTECYQNYFLVLIKNKEGVVHYWEMFNDKRPDTQILSQALISRRTFISFNGLSYDMPMIEAFLSGYTNKQLKALSDDIIVNQARKYHNLPCDHIDIINIPIGQASLKIYAGRLHCQKMQDLPIEPNAVIQESDIINLRQYCQNDVDNTQLIFNEVRQRIDLREEITEQYGIDVRSKSDAQTAEAIIKSELSAITGKQYKPAPYPDDFKFKYKNPDILSFKSDYFNLLFERVLDQDFFLSEKGSVTLPKWLQEDRVSFDFNYIDFDFSNRKYQFGIGGLHSCEKAQTEYSDDEYMICDIDVQSYYPSIIEQLELFPKTLGKDFLKIYSKIIIERLSAKGKASTLAKTISKLTIDTTDLQKEMKRFIVESEVKKIVLNGSFGKFGSKYSVLYSPELLIQVTITGQLALLMLIEKLNMNGFLVISANTDGIVVKLKRSAYDEFKAIVQWWELQTGFRMEETQYKSIHSRDVNNYFVIKPDGKVKSKGIYGDASLGKNPTELIVSKAVIAYVNESIRIEDFIRSNTDIRNFTSIRTVKLGAYFRGEFIGKAVRFYQCANSTDSLVNAKGDKVAKSDGCFPLMQLPDTLPDDINYDYYIAEAIKLCKATGIDYA